MAVFVKKRREIWCRCAVFVFVCTVGLLCLGTAQARIQGACSDCHTMHNSQGNAAMNFDGSTTPNENLTRGDCYGCHAQGGASALVTLGATSIPQVFHTGATDLAGGNFAYITGLKGSGAADNKGHNIGSLTGTDGVLYGPPGGIVQFGHDDGYNVNTDNLSCAGTNGCHGYRYAPSTLPEGVTGSHHKNVDGQLSNPTSPGDSYRFLMGVKGLESPDWQNSAGPTSHNEYFSIASPVQLGCSNLSCHSSSAGVQPPDGTMSQFCATCHGNFHTVATTSSDGIGTVAASPFIRHPTDLSLPATGEYAAYTVYNVNAPVARLSVPAVSSSVVTPGSDTVMCLSCHVAHASDYPDMLRWDYSTMVAGNGGAASDTGCFTCHTTKD
jgi:predicted CxxxxCH...CXXCH cytochrome family protein